MIPFLGYGRFIESVYSSAFFVPHLYLDRRTKILHRMKTIIPSNGLVYAMLLSNIPHIRLISSNGLVALMSHPSTTVIQKTFHNVNIDYGTWVTVW